MQGVFIDGRRPRSKKEVKDTIAADPVRVSVEATSVFGNEFDGTVTDLKDGASVSFVGPDPYTKRNFYGTIEKRGERIVVR